MTKNLIPRHLNATKQDSHIYVGAVVAFFFPFPGVLLALTKVLLALQMSHPSLILNHFCSTNVIHFFFLNESSLLKAGKPVVRDEIRIECKYKTF